MRTLILGLFLFFLNQVSFSKGKSVVLYKGIDEYEIGSYVDILEDKSNKLALKNIQDPRNEHLFKQNKSKGIKFGPHTSTYWLRIKTRKEDGSGLWYLSFSTSKIDHLTFYRNSTDKSTTGLKYSLKSREVMGRFFVFKMDVESVSTFYIKVKNDGVKLPSVKLKILSPSEYKKKDTISEVGNTLYLGILLAMFLYNLLIVVETKSLTDLSYAGWLFFFTLSASYRTGLGQLYLFPDSFFFRSNLVYYLNLCHMSLFSLFAYRFLEINK
ncbi:hypothetical protein OAK75_05635, partial [Bacteriovoracales bacterium]|nr:hypothetical protein [Bacteriovoracales bacterium]